MLANPESLIHSLLRHAHARPSHSAFTFVDSAGSTTTLTFEELLSRVREIRTHLENRTNSGDRVLLACFPGLDFVAAFFGCMAAGVIPVPVFMPRGRRVKGFVDIACDCAAVVVCCHSQSRDHLEQARHSLPKPLDVLCVDEIQSDKCTTGESPDIDIAQNTELGLLQYTSGSTRSPKGVAVTHQNLVSNAQAIERHMSLAPDRPIGGWLPAHHDMGLIGLIAQAAFTGCHSVLMAPTTFLARPVRWLETISQFGIYASGGPNFCFDYCCDRIPDAEREHLDLSSWKTAFCGAEPIRKPTLDRFVDQFSAHGFSASSFFPCYGLAEATLLVSGGWMQAAEQQHERCVTSPASDSRFVSCGRVSEAVDVIITDAVSAQGVSNGVEGEICIAGKSIAKGYWQPNTNIDETFSGLRRADGYLRTGDLGFLRDGELFVTGRVKDLIIIHGRNLYPQDIEAVVAQEFGLTGANSVAAIGLPDEDGERLVVVIEAPRYICRLAVQGCEDNNPECQTEQTFHSRIAACRTAVSREIAVSLSYFAFLAPGKFPRTTSGKVMRQSCRQALIDGTVELLDLPYRPPVNLIPSHA